jgi:hypothetical protein
MADVYRVFQIIFGIIASVFILAFLIQFSGIYSGTQKVSLQLDVLKNFETLLNEVYLTGIPVNYSHFAKYDVKDCYIQPHENKTSKLACDAANIKIAVPTIFYFGDEISVESGNYDTGWWKTKYALAVPDIKVIFTPMTSDPADAWDMMINITSLFRCDFDLKGWSCNDVQIGDPFPGKELDTEVTFGFCEDDVVLDHDCSGYPCSRYEFILYLNRDVPTSLEPCTTTKDYPKYKFVTISDSCSPGDASRGVCVTPPDANGIALAYIVGESGDMDQYILKDPLDLLAVIIGGDDRDEFGETMGDKLYHYKNKVFRERTLFAAKMMVQRSALFEAVILDDPDDAYYDCKDDYHDLRNALESLVTILNDKDFYIEYSKIHDYVQLVDGLGVLFESLVDKGCEYAD